MRTKYAKESTVALEPDTASEAVVAEVAPVSVEEETVETSIEASTETAEATPKRNIISKAVYGAFYSVSYGAVFSGLLIAKLVFPKEGLIATALHDGAVAAQEVFEEHEGEFAELSAHGEPEEIKPAGEEVLLPA